MNNYCRNCGEKLTNSSACEKCGTKILTNRVGELDRLLEKKYIMIFFALFMICIIIPMLLHERIWFLSYYSFSLIHVFIVFVTVAKAKLEYSKFFNIVFWLMLLLIILFILFILFKLMSCDYYRF